MQWFILTMVIGYFLGSIPFSLIIGKVGRGIDVRQFGSGNLGAANTFRTLGPGLGVAVLLLDVAKGSMSVLIGNLLWRQGVPSPAADFMLLGGLSAVCGHIWTVFASFKGGKGVATAAGVFMTVAPLAFLVCLGAWVIIVGVSRYVSLGSLIAALLLPVAVYATASHDGQGWEHIFVISVAVAILVVISHRGNIGRIVRGTERKFSIHGG